MPTKPLRAQRFKRLGLAALLLLAAGSGLWAWQDAGYAPISTVSVGNIGSCEVKFIASYHKTGSGKADLAHLQTLLDKRNHIHCSEPATLLYYDSQSVVPGSAERVRSSYFFYCPQTAMAAGKAQCENYYESLEK